jgi:hypothetical protein
VSPCVSITVPPRDRRGPTVPMLGSRRSRRRATSSREVRHQPEPSAICAVRRRSEREHGTIVGLAARTHADLRVGVRRRLVATCTDRPTGRCQALLAHGRCPHAPSGVGGQPGRQAASRGQRSRLSWAQSGTKIAPCTLPLVTRALSADVMPGRETRLDQRLHGRIVTARAATLTFSR